MKIKPLHDVIAVKMDEVTTTTASGIVLASNKEKSQKAVVLAVGGDIQGIQEGDTLVLTPFAKLTEMKIDGEMITFIKLVDVVAKLN